MTISKIQYTSRKLAEQLRGSPYMAVISITDPATPEARLDPLFRHVLRLSFFDAVPADEFMPPLPGLFDMTMARRIDAFIAAASTALARHHPALRLVVFGHLGDGNLHFNLSPPVDACSPTHAAAFLAQEPSVNTLVHDVVQAHGGSISAEHGLGVLRRDEAARRRDPVAHRLMLRLKAALDPHGLMNPGKVLPLA